MGDDLKIDYPLQAYSDIINKRKGYKMSDFQNMTVVQLKEYAKENSISLDDAKTKTKIISILANIKSSISSVEDSQDIIGSTATLRKNRVPKSSTKNDDSGVFTTTTADNFNKKIFEKDKRINSAKVAIYSEKNMAWSPIGRIKKGYNVVTKGESEKWLSLKGVREATPEEVATYYGI